MLSVIIPCYNQAQYLGECLRSVIAQTYTDWEAIVVDDGSKDAEAVRSQIIQVKDQRIRLVRHEQNRGLGAARNTGIRAASGDLILPVDCDDRLERTFLNETQKAFKENPGVDCIFTDFQLFGASEEVWRYSVKTPVEMLRNQWIPGPGALMRKRLWASNGGYLQMPRHLSGNEDWDFWISAVQRQFKALHIPRALYLYRRSPNSMSVTTMQYNDYLIRETIYLRHKEFFDEHKAGLNFRFQGYLNSAKASLKKDKRLRAAWLACRARRLTRDSSSETRQLARQILRSLCPEPLIQQGLRLKHSLSGRFG